MTDSVLAFAVPVKESPGFEVRVNFGMFAGREATNAEIDDLAASLLEDVGAVSIVAEERHEIDTRSEVSIHQVRIEIAAEALPSDPLEVQELGERVVTAAEQWATACIAERHAEISEI